MMDDERALALRAVECSAKGVSYFENLGSCMVGFGIIGVIAALPIVLIACALRRQFDLAHITVGTLAICFAVVVAGSALIVVTNHTINRDAAMRAAAGLRDIEHGTVIEYSGAVRSASFSSDVREPQIRDLFIHFKDGDKIFVSSDDASRFGLALPPSESARIVRLPNSQIVISCDGR
jgi:hypothetical protein